MVQRSGRRHDGLGGQQNFRNDSVVLHYHEAAVIPSVVGRSREHHHLISDVRRAQICVVLVRDHLCTAVERARSKIIHGRIEELQSDPLSS